ncbi:MAG: S1 RNA-binding domain-containing protein [Bdellovibrionales bacterium]
MTQGSQVDSRQGHFYISQMAKKDLFGDEDSKQETDFQSLFEKSLDRAAGRVSVGQTFKAEILSIGSEEAFVSTGTAQDAILMKSDLLDEEKKLKYKVGDIIDVTVLKIREGEIRVARKGAKKSATDIDSLQDAFDMELPVEGRVLELVKGGFRVDIQGARAFCPISQIDSSFVKDGQEFVNKKFEFLITQLDEQGRNIVVSRKKILELQRAENEGDWLEKVKVGDVLNGEVTRLESFGAFVRMDGGVEGLVHVSEIGFIRLKHASEALKLGEKVQVKVLKAEDVEGRLKISLSIKQAGGVGDPWMQVPVSFPVGTIVDGTVEKKENFGLFVQLVPGITGLLPRSKWRDSAESASFENKKKGDVIKVKVDQILFEERKLSLGLPTEGEDESWRQVQQTSNSMGALAAAFQKAKK